ncbi:hypothetical protein PAPHI01_0687 [Pancytospora philotis]|nr:hypothetical protein PAPHI01_0687 [Pancytospora philotis]
MHIVEYKLRLILDSLTLKVLSIKNLANPKDVADFNSSFYSIKKVQGFCAGVSESTRIPVFNVPLAKGGRTHTVIFCEAAVGRSAFVNSQYAKTLTPPAGFDSLLTNDQEAVDFLYDRNVDIRECEYVVKDSALILPLYEVVFEYDAETERLLRGRVICEGCNAKDAVMYCPAEVASLCEECDRQLHSKALLSRHVRVCFTNAGQKKFMSCCAHPLKAVEYFCDECREPMCADCRLSGSHADAACAQHTVRPFLEACRSSRDMLHDSAAMLGEITSGAGAEMARFKEAANAFRSNIAEIRGRLREEYNNLNNTIDCIESKQRMVINAEYVDRAARQVVAKQMVQYPSQLDPADLLLNLKNVADQWEQARIATVNELAIPRVECHGRVVVDESKPSAKHAVADRTDDRVVAFRVETMNMDSKITETFN